MKPTIYCLLIALCLRLTYSQITPEAHPHFVMLGDWLTLEVRGNTAKPETTRIFTKQVPLFRRTGTGEYEITFQKPFIK